MKLSDNDLMILEQLTYLNSDVIERALSYSECSQFDIKKYKGKTIKEILSVFTQEGLQNLENETSAIGMGGATGIEWASIIRYIQSSDMRNLVLSDIMQKNSSTLALCFTEGKEDNNAIVAFKGTSGKQEWIDNVEGLNMEDTECQKEALEYIECLPYDDITVVGHSKGGNKAMYVAVTSDKVTHCVSMDGQGFSQEFIDKYWAEINAKGGIITNYSVSTDYVHILLFPVPNSEQVYCKGYDGGEGINDLTQHHSPNSFFLTDKSGKLIFDADGNVQIVRTNEDESVAMLHEFTTFVMNNGTVEDKAEIVSYLSGLLSLTFGSEAGTDKIKEYALDDIEALTTILAYLVKYMDEYDLDADDIDKLLEMLGLNSLNFVAGWVINYIKGQLTDNGEDKFTKKVLPWLKKHFFDDIDIDVAMVWEKTDSKVRNISVTRGVENYRAKAGEIHDYSMNVYNTLMSVINKINSLSFEGVSNWNRYAQFEWFSKMLISLAVKGITTYSDNLIKMNNDNKRQIERLFEEIDKRDMVNANKIKRENILLKTINNNLLSLRV